MNAVTRKRLNCSLSAITINNNNMARLTYEQRVQCCTLYTIAGWSYDRISLRLVIPRSTVRLAARFRSTRDAELTVKTAVFDLAKTSISFVAARPCPPAMMQAKIKICMISFSESFKKSAIRENILLIQVDLDC